MYAADAVPVGRKLILGSIAQRRAVSRIVVYFQLGVRERLQQFGEFRRAEGCFEMNLDLRLFREGQGRFESILDYDNIVFRTNRRRVDEWDHYPLHSERAGVAEKTGQFLEAFVTLVCRATHERFIHKVVGADGTNGDSGGFGETLQPVYSPRVAEWVYIVAVKVVDPLNVVERNFGRVRKLALPVLAREGLKAAIFGRHEPPLHDSVLGHSCLRAVFIEPRQPKITLLRGLRSCYSRTRRDRAEATNLREAWKGTIRRGAEPRLRA